VVRPSGTEPKLKAYLQVVEPVGGAAALPAARVAAEARLAALRTEVEQLLGRAPAADRPAAGAGGGAV
jgi:phosphomannomutase